MGERQTHALDGRRARKLGMSRVEEKTRCGLVHVRVLGIVSGPTLAEAGTVPTCERCAKGGAR